MNLVSGCPVNTSDTTVKKFELGYAYAANGNLTGKSVYDADIGSVQDAWTYDYANHAATSITTTQAGARFSMQYDAAGNMITQSDASKNLAKQMAYDSYNRIRQVTDQGTGTIKGTYWYDDQGFRVRREAARTVEGEEHHVQLLYPSMYFSVETEKNQNGVPIEGTGFGVNNIYLNGVRIAAALPNADTQYYLTDQVDSVKVVTNDAGFVVTAHEYLPFGEDWITEGDSKNEPKFNSQELDKESGYYFYNARHYDPEIARFVTPDTVIDGENSTQGWNRFSYVHNNPIRYKDPTGHASADVQSAANNAKMNPVTTLVNNPGMGSSPTINKGSTDGTIQTHANKMSQMAKGPDRLGGQDYRNILINNFERDNSGRLVRDSNGYATSKIGDTIVKFKPGVGNPINSLNAMNDKSMKVFGDMATDKNLNLSEITVSSLYRSGEKNYPHSAGRGIDITEMKSGKNIAKFNDMDLRNSRSESSLANKVTDWLRNNKEVIQAYTPWQMVDKAWGQERDGANNWRDNPTKTNTLDYQHRDHLHIGTPR